MFPKALLTLRPYQRPLQRKRTSSEESTIDFRFESSLYYSSGHLNYFKLNYYLTHFRLNKIKKNKVCACSHLEQRSLARETWRRESAL